MSPSPSPSASISPSLSPSIPAGTVYTRGNYTVLPTDNADLETSYSGQDYIDVEDDDAVRVSQQADVGDYAVHQFKDIIVGDSATFHCNLQSNLAPSVSTVYLQIYNHNTPGWETIDSDGASPANTDFDLQALVADLTNYKDGNEVTCRVYQQG